MRTREDRNAAGFAFACDAKASYNPRLHVDGREERLVELLRCHPRRNSDPEPSVLCNHLPPPTETDTQSSQETQDETTGECCIDDVWANSSTGKKTSHNIHTMVVSNSVCVVKFGDERSFLCCAHQSSLFASFFPTSENFRKRVPATNHFTQKKNLGVPTSLILKNNCAERSWELLLPEPFPQLQHLPSGDRVCQCGSE